MKLPKKVFDVQSISNLFLISLSIWGLTNVSYSILSWPITSMQSDNSLIIYCLIVVMLLAILSIVFFSDYSFSSNFKSYGKLLSYALVIYFLTNGIQSLYSSIQAPSQNTISKAELIPFLDSRPWLPPAGLRKGLLASQSENLELTTLNYSLEHSLDSAVSRLESCGLMTDSIFLTVIPASREVGKGGVFRSEVVLAARLDKSYVKNVMVNNVPISLESGVGVFKENTGDHNDGIRTLNYEADIELYGESQTIRANDSYRVMRPYIEVSSQAVNSLFLNCGNQLNIQVPVLGSDYHPTFKVDGGSFKKSNEPGKITVLPTSRQVEIDVYNKNAYIGKKSFPVRRIPSPTVRPFANGKPIDINQGVPRSISSLSLSVNPDADFQRMLPNDANYIVQDCEISLISNGTIKSKMKGKGNTNISSMTRKAKSGDQLKVIIKTVLRKNFKGDIEKVLTYYPKTFTITLK